MISKADMRLIRDTSAVVQRVIHNLASTPMQVAHQADESTRSIQTFLHVAIENAEMLEREARNLRDSISHHLSDAR